MISSKRGMAYGQMFLLVFSVVAFGFLVGGVAGQTPNLATVPEGGTLRTGGELPSASPVAANSPFTATPIQAATLQQHGGAISTVNNFQVGGISLENGVLAKDGTLVASDGTLFHTTGSGWEAGSAVTTTTAETVTTAGYAGKGTLGSLFTGNAFANPFLSALASGAIWGAIVGGIAYFGAKLFGLTNKQAESIGLGAGAGAFTGTTLYFMGQNAVAAGSYTQATLPFFISPVGALLSGVVVGGTIIVLTYKKEKKEIIRFECLPWEPPLGGSKCEECNKDTLRPCSEYRCKSLGQACEIVNPGTEEELCVWVGKGDVTPPSMKPWEDALKPDELGYIPDNTIRQPDKGVKIVRPSGKGCLQAYTALQFGIETNEPAQCRASLLNPSGYDNMSMMFGDNLFRYNHSIQFNVPNPFAQEDGDNVIPEIHNDGTYTIWTRCVDANGNGKDAGAFAFRFCIDDAPDTEAPKIVGSSIENGKPVRFNADSVPIEIYINEPAECKWSREDKAYKVMENTMNCDTNSFRFNSNLNYVCSGQLTNVKNRENNKYYFRCLDMSTAPSGRNEMRTSFSLTLRGTEQLTITKAGPTGTIEGSTTVVEVPLTVETAHGANEGESICYFSLIKDDNKPTPMESEPRYEHNQSIFIPGGDYTYYYRCIDEGGNVAETNATFKVVIDTSIPLISRALKDNENLKIITTENAQCVYSETNCNYNFESGKPMTYEDPTKKIVHVTAWNQEITYYVKCKDLQGNQPVPNQCSIIVQGTEL